MSTLNELIGTEMRNKRLLKRMTLQQVADRMGKVKNTISYLELGKINITVEDLKQYCEIVGCDYIEILNNAEMESAESRGN